MDLIGHRYGRLTVVTISEPTAKGKPQWVCRCDCGNEHVASASNLRNGTVRSCGCLRSESARRASSMRRTHGLTGSRLERIWKGMCTRCYNRRSLAFAYYGDRGIVICDEWLMNRAAFFNWALSSGYRDWFSIDRINNDGPYSPENCRWVNAIEQANNTRRNRVIEHGGMRLTLAQWAKRAGISTGLLWWRLESGWEIAMAVNTKTRNHTT